MVENSKKEDKRKFKRFPIQLGALYLEEFGKEWKGCSVVNVSREGMRIEAYLKERIYLGEILQFKIIIPAKEEPIKTTGTLMWIKELKEKMGFVGGIKLFDIASEEIWTLLDYASENWAGKEVE